MMGQINPAGFQSPMCMFYVYVIVEIKYFWLWKKKKKKKKWHIIKYKCFLFTKEPRSRNVWDKNLYLSLI